MAIPRTKKHDVVLPARPPPSSSSSAATTTRPTATAPASTRPHYSSGVKGLVEDPQLDVAANQWGDFEAPYDPHPHPHTHGRVHISTSRDGNGNGDGSHVAALTRELKALETRYFRTREQLDKTTERNDQLRGDMTKTRTHSAKLERDNAKLRHLIDRIQSEKKLVEQQAISNRDYAQKIEHKFFLGAPRAQTQTLVQSNVELTSRVKTLERELVQKDQELHTGQRELEAALEKVGILKRALETRFEELELNGSLHTGILFELSRLQDQNASMALHVGEERKTSRALEVQLDVARSKQLQLEEHLVVRETWLAALENDRAELSDQLASSENDRQTFAFEKATLLKFIQQQAELKFQLEADFKRVQDSKLAELELFHAKVQTLMDDKQTLQLTANELLVKLEKTQLEASSVEKSWRQEQTTSEELRTRQHELFLEIQRLQDDVRQRDDDLRASYDQCRQLQTTIDTQQRAALSQQSKIDELEAIVSALEQEIQQRKDEETALRTAMETALHDLHVLSTQRNEAARAMNEAVTISASSLDEQQALETKVETQRKQLEQLKHAKSLLQNAMLEQLSALRKQLQAERMQRIEAEAKLKQHRSVDVSRRSGSGSGSSGRSSSSSSPAHVLAPPPSSSPLDSTAAMQEELHPLPPPEISLPSPLPPHMAMLQKQLQPPHRRRRGTRSVSSGSSSSSSDGEQDDDDQPSPPPQHRNLVSTPERTPRSPSIPSPSDSLSLLELAGDL